MSVEAAVVYNSSDSGYLVKWSGDDDSGGLVDGEYDFFGNRINAASGDELGETNFHVSDGGTVNKTLRAYEPLVPCNNSGTEYRTVRHAGGGGG